MLKKQPFVFWLLLAGLIVLGMPLTYIMGSDLPRCYGWWKMNPSLFLVSAFTISIGSIVWLVVAGAWLSIKLLPRHAKQ